MCTRNTKIIKLQCHMLHLSHPKQYPSFLDEWAFNSQFTVYIANISGVMTIVQNYYDNI